MTFFFWLVVAIYLWYAWRHYYGEYKFRKARKQMYDRLEQINE